MRMEVDGQINSLFESRHQPVGRFRFQQTRHVLDTEDVGAHFLQFTGHGNVILQVVLAAGQDIPRVADGRLGYLAGAQDGVDGHPHALQPVEAVENAEHVDAAICRLGDEAAHHVVGVVGVAHGIGGAEEHLEEDVRHPGPESRQPLPGILVQEAVRHIKCRAAPHFE